MNIRDLIADLRGGFPEACDMCQQKKEPDELTPISGGEWLCLPCLHKYMAPWREDVAK